MWTDTLYVFSVIAFSTPPGVSIISDRKCGPSFFEIQQSAGNVSVSIVAVLNILTSARCHFGLKYASSCPISMCEIFPTFFASAMKKSSSIARSKLSLSLSSISFPVSPLSPKIVMCTFAFVPASVTSDVHVSILYDVVAAFGSFFAAANVCRIFFGFVPRSNQL